MDRRSFIGALGASPLAAAVPEARGTLVDETRHAPPSSEPGFGTGIDELDRLLGPLGPGDLLAIGGPMTSGKTALALSLARHVCEAHGLHAVYSGPHILGVGHLARACRTLSRLERGRLHVQCMNERLELSHLPAGSLGLVVVDDLAYRLAVLDPHWNESPDRLVAELERLKALAVRHGCAVVAILELGAGGYPDGRLPSGVPRLADLAGVAGPLQHIGRVLLTYRPAAYLPSRGLDAQLVEVAVPPQCGRADAELGGSWLIADDETSLYRSLTEEEWNELDEHFQHRLEQRLTELRQ